MPHKIKPIVVRRKASERSAMVVSAAKHAARATFRGLQEGCPIFAFKSTFSDQGISQRERVELLIRKVVCSARTAKGFTESLANSRDCPAKQSCLRIMKCLQGCQKEVPEELLGTKQSKYHLSYLDME